MLMASWLLLAVAVVLAVLWLSQRREDERDDVALQVPDRRLAQSELTVDEHAQRRQALRERGHGARSAQWGGLVAVSGGDMYPTVRRPRLSWNNSPPHLDGEVTHSPSRMIVRPVISAPLRHA